MNTTLRYDGTKMTLAFPKRITDVELHTLRKILKPNSEFINRGGQTVFVLNHINPNVNMDGLI